MARSLINIAQQYYEDTEADITDIKISKHPDLAAIQKVVIISFKYTAMGIGNLFINIKQWVVFYLVLIILGGFINHFLLNKEYSFSSVLLAIAIITPTFITLFAPPNHCNSLQTMHDKINNATVRLKQSQVNTTKVLDILEHEVDEIFKTAKKRVFTLSSILCFIAAYFLCMFYKCIDAQASNDAFAYAIYAQYQFYALCTLFILLFPVWGYSRATQIFYRVLKSGCNQHRYNLETATDQTTTEKNNVPQKIIADIAPSMA